VTGRLSWRKLVRAALLSIALVGVLLWLSGFVFRTLVPHENDQSKNLFSARLHHATAVVHLDKLPAPLTETERRRDRLAVILDRKSIRVGVRSDVLPFVFTNLQGELVGFDMTLLHDLAQDLDVHLHVVQVDRSQRGELLDNGGIDILAGGIAVTPDNVNFGTFPMPYLDQTAALVVPDHRRGEFTDLKIIRSMKKLKIAVHSEYYLQRLKHVLPDAEYVLVDSIEGFLKGEMPDVDALLYTAEAGSAWTFLYPQNAVVVPEGFRVKVPTGFLIPTGSDRFYDFMNTWMVLKVKNGQIAEAYDRWILGQGVTAQELRWSVVRNVLHWVD
ncbi:MAG: transporter substrate-binding domain-containing protein, partial [Lysobacterales bacterium]